MNAFGCISHWQIFGLLCFAPCVRSSTASERPDRQPMVAGEPERTPRRPRLATFNSAETNAKTKNTAEPCR